MNEQENTQVATSAEELERRLFDSTVAKSELEHYAARQLQMVDEALTRRERLDGYTNRYSKIHALCGIAGNMETVIMQARAFLQGKARRDLNEKQIVEMLGKAVEILDVVPLTWDERRALAAKEIAGS